MAETGPAPPPMITSAAPSSGHRAQGPGNIDAPSMKKPVDTTRTTPAAGNQGRIFAGSDVPAAT